MRKFCLALNSKKSTKCQSKGQVCICMRSPKEGETAVRRRKGQGNSLGNCNLEVYNLKTYRLIKQTYSKEIRNVYRYYIDDFLRLLQYFYIAFYLM